MIMLLVILLSAAMLIGALAAVHLKKTVPAIIAAGIVSLFASVLYLLLAAPDVAMTEAAIGAGLSTVIFLYAVHKTRSGESEND